MKRLKQDRPLAFAMWHGGRKWQSGPEIMPNKKGQAERGPGIYCTDNYMTARKYAQGGGQVRRLMIEPKGILEDIAIPLADAIRFVKSNLMRKTQGDIIERLQRGSALIKPELYTLKGEGPHVPLSNLNNLCVNSDQAHGERGLTLNRFLVENGADASFEYAMGREVWGVIFNPTCITSHEVVPAKDVDWSENHLPDPVQQIRAYRESRKKGEPDHIAADFQFDADTTPSM